MSSMLPRKRKRRGPGRPPRSESRHTRTDIMAAALKHFSKGGYHATSLRKIAGTANVDLATVKYHYEDKVTLYNAAFLQGHTQLVEQFIPRVGRLKDAETPEQLEEIIRDLATESVKLVQTHNEFIRLLFFRMLEDIEYPDELLNMYDTEIGRALTEQFATIKERPFINDIHVGRLITMLMISVPSMVISNSAHLREDANIVAEDQSIRDFAQKMLTALLVAPAA